MNDEAQYLLINDHPVRGWIGLLSTFPMGCAVPRAQLHLDRSFASELVDFLQFNSGHPFEEKSA